MDDKRRTEPKFRDEELQDAIDRVGIFWERYGQIIMIALIIVFAGYAGYKWLNHRNATAHEEAYSQLVSTNSPGALANLANDINNANVRTLAYLRAGDAYLAELAQKLMAVWTGDERNRPVTWALATARYEVGR